MSVETDWPFVWPPKRERPIVLWMPQTPEETAGWLDAAAANQELATLRMEALGHHAGGTAVSIEVSRGRWLRRQFNFDSLRYPLVATLGVLFVVGLGVFGGNFVSDNLFAGSLKLTAAMAAALWLLWGMGVWLGSTAKGDIEPQPESLQALAVRLSERGARHLPESESPFRR